MTEIDFFASGTPIPQGSKTIRRHGDKAWLTDVNDKALKNWRESVRKQAVIAMAGHEPFDCPVEVKATFYMPRPSSVTRSLPAVKPDLDKLLRALLDSLDPCMVNDSRVCDVIVKKRYALYNHESGVLVHIKEIS